MNDQNPGSSNIAAFLAGAATALIAGGYFLYGPGGKRHQKQAGAFLARAKEELVERIADAEDLTERSYRKLLSEVARAQGLSAAQARTFVEKFKNKLEDLREEARASADEAELEMEDE